VPQFGAYGFMGFPATSNFHYLKMKITDKLHVVKLGKEIEIVRNVYCAAQKYINHLGQLSIKVIRSLS